jgi:hypothetical protein
MDDKTDEAILAQRSKDRSSFKSSLVMDLNAWCMILQPAMIIKE